MKIIVQKILFLAIVFSAAISMKAQSAFSVDLSLGSSTLHHTNSHLLDNGNVISAVFDASSSSSHIVMINANGTKAWSKSYLSTRIDDIKVLANGKIAFAGYYGYDHSVWGVLDQNGNELWAKKYYSFDYSYDLASVTVLANEKILYSFSKFYSNLTVRCDEDGETEDCDEEGDSLGNGKSPRFDSFGCDDSGYVDCGKSDDRVMIIRHNANGDVIWAKNYMKASTEYFHLKKIKQLADGSFMGVGLVSDVYCGPNNNGFIMKLDANGEVLWTKKYTLPSNPGYFSSTFRSFEIEGSNIYIGGYYTSDNLNMNNFLIQMDADGNVISSKQIVTTGNALATVGVPMSSSVTFEQDMKDHHFIYNNYSAGEGMNVELNKVSFDGTLGCEVTDFPITAITYSAFTNTSPAAYFQNSILQSNPSAILDQSTVVNSSDIVVSNACASVAGIEEELNLELSAYPNPASNVLNISGLNTEAGYWVQVIDINGKVVLSQNGIEGVAMTTLNVSNLNNATYIVKVQDIQSGSSKQMRWIKL